MRSTATKIHSECPAVPREPSDRDKINQLVRDYSRNHRIAYALAWNALYKTVSQRLGESFTYKASMHKMQPLDYLESRGLMGYVLAVAVELFEE